VRKIVSFKRINFSEEIRHCWDTTCGTAQQVSKELGGDRIANKAMK
jgi:hypothetical protein